MSSSSVILTASMRKRPTRQCVQPCNRQKIQKIVDRTIQLRAFNDLLQIRMDKGGELGYGDIEGLLKQYHLEGYHCVTRDNL
jgi:hypothetical protein